MTHLVQIPPPDSGGGSFAANGTALVSVKWQPSHELAPAVERHRIEKADKMRRVIEDMLNAPPDAPTE